MDQPGFHRLRFGQTVSEFGSEVTALALSLAAVLVLHASTFQVEMLTTTGFAWFLLIGLPAGVRVDRVRRKPVMIAADVTRVLALAPIPGRLRAWADPDWSAMEAPVGAPRYLAGLQVQAALSRSARPRIS